MNLMKTDILQLSAGPALQVNVTENSCIGQLGTPVPAKHGMGFSHQLISLHSTCGGVLNLLVFCVLIIVHIFQYRQEFNADVVFTRYKHFPHRNPPGPVHIVGVKDLFLIDIDFRQGIQTFTDQLHLLCFQEILFHIKIFPENVVIPEELPDLIFISSVKGIRDCVCLQKKRQNRAGNRPFILSFFASSVHGPEAVKR